MGVVAYTGCTLIFAVMVHALYTRSTAKSKSVYNAPSQSLSGRQAEDSVETSTDEDDKDSIESTVSLVVSEHDEKITKDSMEGYGQTRLSNDHDIQIPAVDVKENRGSSQQHTAPPSAVMNGLQPQQKSMPPPALPLLSRSKSPPRLKPPTVSSLAPSPRILPTTNNPSMMPPPPPSTASSLRVPAQKKLTNTSMQPSLAPATSTLAPSKRPSRKVILSPGHSPLDWAALTKSNAPDAAARLRGESAYNRYGPHKLARITPSHLKSQTGRKGKDAWTSYAGKVYNISAYLKFHPGGEAELLKGAGRSSDELFAEVHPWVNWDGMLSGCLVGRLVDEDDIEARAEKEAYERWVSEGHSETTDGTTGINELDEMD